jgi:hypothetical protein
MRSGRAELVALSATSFSNCRLYGPKPFMLEGNIERKLQHAKAGL